MSMNFRRNKFNRTKRSPKLRRPEGISRRQRRKQLSFETLEDRRVMSADPVVSTLSDAEIELRNILLDDSTIMNAFDSVSDLSKYTEEQLLSTTEWMLLADETANINQLVADYGLNIVGDTGILPGSYIIDVGDSSQDLMDSLLNNDLVDYFYPLIDLNSNSLAIPNDPLQSQQWYLNNFGQEVGGPGFQFIRGVPDEDINILAAWEDPNGTSGTGGTGWSGEGIQIAIVDDGVLFDHPDLAANIRADLATDVISFGDGNPSAINGHGTAVAGIAAGVGDNGIGITGVAYNADIVPIRLLNTNGAGIGAGITDAQVAQALLHEFQTIDVYNHSWGFVGATNRTMLDFGPLSLIALRNSVFFGRGGLGSIHVFAAGNDGTFDTSSQFDGLVNSRYTIGVTALDHDGVPENVDGTTTTYPEAGANVLIAAYSGSVPLEIIRDTAIGSGIVTTDLPDDDGFNSGPDENNLETDFDYLFDETIEGQLLDYTSRFNGTSAAAPIVSGTIALMLEVNPELTYRDVQHILVRTARQASPENDYWVTNLRKHQRDPLATNLILGVDVPPDGLWPYFPGFGLGSPPEYITPEVPDQFTNGAGFTVSQGYATGFYGEDGIGHGVIDAYAAVRMAMNWKTVGAQQSELTWTTDNTATGKVWGRHISSEETGEILVPGGIAGDGDDTASFEDYYDEFGDESPFVDDDGNPDEDIPFNDRDFGLFVHGQSGILIDGIPSMSVEWVEVALNLGGTPEDMNSLRVTLVSPDGTHSELIPWGQDVPNATDHLDYIQQFGSPGGDPGTTNLILSTNRHWGERTESKIRVDSQGNPVQDILGEDIEDGWRLVFENYGDNEIDIGSYNVTFHGINTEGTSRVQGAIGVDDNADGFFSDTSGTADNYNRYVVSIDPDTGAEVHTANPDQESFAGGVMVYVDINQDGIRDETEPSFETGDDGNYYFDLPPGTYDIRIDDTFLPDDLNNSANIILAQTGPLTTVTVSDVGMRYTPREMPGDATITALNAKLASNSPTFETTISFSGTVFSDLDGNGINDGSDGPLEGAELFLDINQNGIYDPVTDPLATTDASGNYTLTTNPAVPPNPGYYSVFVIDGTTGTFTVPTNTLDGEQASFASLQEGYNTITDIDFGFAPANFDNGGGGGGGGEGGGGEGGGEIDPSTPGSISGVVFLDANGNGTRESELGASGVLVYIDTNPNETFDYVDANLNGVFDSGDTAIEDYRITSVTGAYNFASLAPDNTYVVRIETPDGFTQTAPNSIRHTVEVQPGFAYLNRNFGIQSLAINDWGDLPAEYNMTLAEDDGAFHLISSVFFLGTVDGEIDGLETSDATGDDVTTSDDEDIEITEIDINATQLSFDVIANSNGGYLRAWMDFNGDFDFDDEGEEVAFVVDPADGDFVELDGKVRRKLLTAGQNSLTIEVPNALLQANTLGVVNARFRYGEFEITLPTGGAAIGEVEDLQITIDTGVSAQLAANGPDLNNDGQVDGSDFLSFFRGFGSLNATAEQGDSNGDEVVDGNDLMDLQSSFGAGVFSPPAPVVLESDFNEDNKTDGADLLNLFRGFGDQSASLSDGDGDGDGDVDASDIQVWMMGFGSEEEQSVVSASTYDEATSNTNYIEPLSAVESSTEPLLTSVSTTTAQQPIVLSTVAVATEPAPIEDSLETETPSLFDYTSRFIAQAGQRIHLDRIERLFSKADDVFDRIGERIQEEEIFDRDSIRELRESVRDDVYDYVEVKRRNFFELYEEFKSNVEEEGDALATAIADKINWRLG